MRNHQGCFKIWVKFDLIDTPFVSCLPLVSAASLFNPSWSGSRLRQKQITFHIPESTSTIQQLQTLTKSIIIRHKGQQAYTRARTSTHTNHRHPHAHRLYSQKHTISQNHTTDYKQLGLDSDLLYTTTSSAKVSGG